MYAPTPVVVIASTLPSVQKSSGKNGKYGGLLKISSLRTSYPLKSPLPRGRISRGD